MVQKQSAVRFAAFAGVMIVMSGLVLTLFDEARAVDMEFTSPASAPSFSGSQTFSVKMTVPQNTYVPVDDVLAFVEQGSSNGKQGATLVAQATCDFGLIASGTPTSMSCGSDGISNNTDNDFTARTGSRSGAVSAIIFKGFYTDANNVGESGYAHEAAQFFGYQNLNGLSTTGYGYNPTYGYGYSASTQTYNALGQGYGYGYGTSTLYMQFDIVVAGSALTAGTHYLTLGIDTGSNTVGTLYSPYQEFTVTSSPGGGGGGSGSGGTGDGGTGDGGSGDGGSGATVTVTASRNNNPPAGASESYSAKVETAKKGDKVQVETGSERVGTIELTLDGDADGAEVTVNRFPAETPPEGTTPPPEGVRVTDFVQVQITVGGTTHTVNIAVSVPESDAGDPDKAVLLKYNPDTEAWEPQSRVQLTLENGVFSGTGSAPCCSDFAVGFDEEDPNVTLAIASGALSGLQTLTAEASDNLQLDHVAFYLGETLLGSDDEAPYTWELDTTEHENGEVLLKAVAYDFVGNSAEHSQTAMFSNQDMTPPPGGDDDGGTTPETKGGIAWGWIVLAVAVVLVVIALVAYAGRKK